MSQVLHIRFAICNLQIENPMLYKQKVGRKLKKVGRKSSVQRKR